MVENPYQPPTSNERASTLNAHVLGPTISGFGTVVLVVAVLHVRSDRSRSRQPIVTYAGPLSAWMPLLVYAGLGLSLFGFLVGAFIVNRKRDSSTLDSASMSATIAMTVAAVNALGSFIAYCGIWED